MTAQHTTHIDAILADFVSPHDDPEGRARALATLRSWHLGIETDDFALLESLMHEDIVIELPSMKAAAPKPASTASMKASPPASNSGG